MPSEIVKVGDWVCFYRNARLVIAEVRYTRKEIGSVGVFCTDFGEVNPDSVREVRHAE